MAQLGVTVQTRTAPPARGAPTDTGTAFVAGKAASGDLTKAILVRSMADFEAAYGARTGITIPLYDWLDTFFREGGQRAYVARYSTDPTIALALFPKTLGPGQVAYTDETPAATSFGQLLDHAAQNGRFAVLDVGASDTVAAMVTLGGTIPTTNQTYGAAFGPRVIVPAPAGTIGQGTRTVHASAVAAALMARVDSGGNPNRAAAGRDYPLQYATGFARDLTDADMTSLLNAGINPLANINGVLEVYGFQTKLAQNSEDPFWQANVSRTRMWLTAQAKSIGENFMFRPIDGRGRLAAQLQTALTGPLLDLYNADGLYGETAADAFTVSVGASVNTVATVAQGELHAVAEIRPSPHAKSVVIDLVTVPITGNVSRAQ